MESDDVAVQDNDTLFLNKKVLNVVSTFLTNVSEHLPSFFRVQMDQ